MKLNTRIKKGIGLICMFIILYGCAASKVDTSSSNKILDDLVLQKSFIIESEWAQPRVSGAFASVANSGLLPPGSSAGMISLIGNPNYLTIKGDSISGYLPYFGERQMGGSYGSSDTAIQFDGIPTNYKMNSKKNGYEIRFNIPHKKNSVENYSIYIQLFSNLNSNITVTSSQRFSISYRGKAAVIEKK